MNRTKTLVWDPSVSQSLRAPNNSGQEGSEILGNYLYATDIVGSDIDIYTIDAQTGALSYVSSFGSEGNGDGEFGAFSLVDLSFYQLDGGQTKAYIPDAENQRIAVVDVNTTTGQLSWDAGNTLVDRSHLGLVYGIEINGNFLYVTDFGSSNIDIYALDSETGGLTYVRTFGSDGEGVNQFSAESPVDISFLTLSSGATKAYVPDGLNQRIVVLDVNTETGVLTWDEANTIANGVAGVESYGLEIHGSVLYVTNYFSGGIELYDIDLETGALTYTHSVGSPGDGEGEFGTPIDLSFYTIEDGTTRAYVTDSENQRIAALTVSDFELPPDFVVTEQQLLKVGRSQPSQLTLTLEQSQVSQLSEVIVITTDNAEGKIDGIGIGEDGYLRAAQPKAQTVFSVLDSASGFDGLILERALEIAGDSFLNFAVLQGGSLEDAIQNPSRVTVTFGAQPLSESDALAQSVLSQSEGDAVKGTPVVIGLPEDSTDVANSNQLSTGSILLRAELSSHGLSVIGTSLQGSSAESELIDLTAENGPLTASFEVYREADFDSVINFFAVDNAQGEVVDGTGMRFSPGDEDYIQAALANRIALNLTSQDEKMSEFTAEIEGGQLLSSFMVVGGTVEALLNDSTSDDPAIFFTHIGANSDGVDHIRLLGENTFGYEDMAGGGDADFNDIVVKTRFM
ncbi:MAG: DUF4114 domain-containing protein [Cyanobacteria bacterium P01_F01_bin.3]